MKGYETEFVKMAQEKGIEIKGLEKVKEQMDVLDEFLTKEEFMESLEGDEVAITMLRELVTDYMEEDIQGMEKLYSDEEYMGEEERDLLLTNRNNNWIKKMPKIMKKKSTFFAVGSAHLIGEIGLIERLRKLGYTVTPIYS